MIVSTSITDPNKGETLIEICKRNRDYDTLQILVSFNECDPDIIKSSHI
jgi:hypothetical protein